jgi:hypothetical protein
MGRAIQWHVSSEGDTLLVVEDSLVLRAQRADAQLISDFLNDLDPVGSNLFPDPQMVDQPLAPDAWGATVIARGGSGEVLELDPELFWDGIYRLFRSRGQDYDDVPRKRAWLQLHSRSTPEDPECG